jgi:hypothetical protein
LVRDIAFGFEDRTYRFAHRILTDEAAEIVSALRQFGLAASD